MNLYLLSQDQNTGCETYDSMIVAADNEESAKAIHPDGETGWGRPRYLATWCDSTDHVSCELIGVAKAGTETGIILASFNAG